MAVLRIRGVALSDGEPVDLYADGDRWTADPVPGAELVAEGWILPGLVDAHTHPGAEAPGRPLDDDILRSDLRAHLDSGVTLIRSPGLAGDPPAWFGGEDDSPRAVHAGPWIVQQGQFFEGWGRRPEPVDLPAVAAEQAGRTGWAKVVVDWKPGDDVIPVGVLREAVARVHAAGGRLAVHSQHAAGGEAAVEAGVDSIEHGMGLDPALLPLLAERGIALTPTLAVITESLQRIAADPEAAGRSWYVPGASAHGRLTAAAVEAGVTVLAGTDTRPHGGIAREVRAMVAARVSPHEAIAAASWTARAYLGLPGLVEGAPADAVVYDADPRADLNLLGKPRAVILRGKRIQ
ncbi:amidohydrolase family protein [Paractinoplanes atraurantiacus]|uniref:Imidazolonepropionase n=1 Tax=Paractinoplanes atraurantiacus TaxID=1036182 RepID=A0A285IPI2_9ACTN|nr:amidohydrolase family protein [Actinoplanes atraurantiacus]SNY49743.1 Imidazolonepropionase [Actinoplanes atraurantiacus]